MRDLIQTWTNGSRGYSALLFNSDIRRMKKSKTEYPLPASGAAGDCWRLENLLNRGFDVAENAPAVGPQD
jgi:hypothetical protein